ncbi:hypothetical protein NE237_008511 [Protea cynaroides]|uniref:Pre-mRNA-splicing factor Syf1/CRNKL1-like C-terminal HAT-repeats domain-containing protein n=1 Tax=Protea cynaroides TaxID=273540 RepID=A0A9Q0KWM3_9MAGN|nr:hypothetical protein NE237_008511 [Protea cynaroides]
MSEPWNQVSQTKIIRPFCRSIFGADFWKRWHDFEVQYRNEDTFREMLCIKCSVAASYSQMHFILPEYSVQKDQKLNLEETVDTLKRAGVSEDEMTAPAKDCGRKVGFFSAGMELQPGVIQTPDGGRKVTAYNEEIELTEDSDTEQ